MHVHALQLGFLFHKMKNVGGGTQTGGDMFFFLFNQKQPLIKCDTVIIHLVKNGCPYMYKCILHVII